MTLTTADPQSVRRAPDFGRLLAQVNQAGLLQRSAVRYLPRLGVLGAMAVGGLVVFVLAGDSWWQLATAVYAGLLFAQLGFLGHDAGHQQIFRRRRWNDLLGLGLANLGVGLSYGWWVDKHNRHHRNPNEIGRDPDVDRNVLAWTPQQAQRQRGALRVIVRHQGAFFFPLLLMEAWNLHVGSIRALARDWRGRKHEAVLLSLHGIGAVVLLLAVMSPVKALVFVVVQQSVFGLYIGSTFAPNHKGMQMIDAGERPDFLRRQVLTSRNISGGVITATVFGGLNYQIEHHLFPSMPSHNLARCRPLVKDFCATLGVPYAETSPLESYRRVLRYLEGLRPQF